MFTRFDPAARRVLRSAEQACRNHNHYYLGVGHVLLALVEEDDAEIGALLKARGLVASEVVSSLRQALGTGDDRQWTGILVTPRVGRVVAIAEREAGPGALVSPRHLFEAILIDGAGLAAEVLAPHESAAERSVVARSH